MPFLWHPLVVHFPVALWLTSVVFDLQFARTTEPFYAGASRWLIGLGLLAAGVSVLTGFMDYRPLVAQGVGQAFIDQHRVHSTVAYVTTFLYAVMFFVRWRGLVMSRAAYLAMTLLAAGMIAVTGYLGGEIRRVM